MLISEIKLSKKKQKIYNYNTIDVFFTLVVMLVGPQLKELCV